MEAKAKASLKTRDMAYCALMSVLIAVCSWISLPIGQVPFTLQTFGVFCALGLLSAVLCFAMVARVYLARANRAPVVWGGALSRKETAKVAAAVLAVIAAVVVTEVTKP